MNPENASLEFCALSTWIRSPNRCSWPASSANTNHTRATAKESRKAFVKKMELVLQPHEDCHPRVLSRFHSSSNASQHLPRAATNLGTQRTPHLRYAFVVFLSLVCANAHARSTAFLATFSRATCVQPTIMAFPQGPCPLGTLPLTLSSGGSNRDSLMVRCSRQPSSRAHAGQHDRMPELLFVCVF